MKVVRDGEDKTNDLGVFSSYIVWSRLEDMLLMHAEALAVLNRPEDALVDLNTLRGVRNLRSLSYAKDLQGNKLAEGNLSGTSQGVDGRRTLLV